MARDVQRSELEVLLHNFFYWILLIDFCFFKASKSAAIDTPVLPPSVSLTQPSIHTPPSFMPQMQPISASPALSTVTINISSSSSGPVITASASATPAVSSAASSLQAPLPAPLPVPAPAHGLPAEDPRTLKWNQISNKIVQDKLARHQWEWLGGNWVPHYTYQTVYTIMDVWTEWAEGLNGYISVRELTEIWGVKWRRNIAYLKTENTRRRKIVDLINTLSGKQGWNLNMTQKFLSEQYDSKYTARTFSEYMKKEENKAAVMELAATYFA